MSVEFFVVCRRPLPTRSGGWSLSVGPVAISEVPAGDELRAEVVMASGGPASAVLNLSSRAIGAEASYQMGCVLAEATGGVIFNEDDFDEGDDFAGAAPRTATAAELEAELQQVVTKLAKAEQQGRAVAKERWEQVSAADPRTKKENDWSDL